MKTYWLIVNIILQIPLYSQIAEQNDTVRIYKKQAGMPFRKYYQLWFESKYSRASFSYQLKNHQDSLIVHDTAAKYYMVYDLNNRLIFEGRKETSGTSLTGKVRFYYPTGNIKRIEYWIGAAYAKILARMNIVFSMEWFLTATGLIIEKTAPYHTKQNLFSREAVKKDEQRSDVK